MLDPIADMLIRSYFDTAVYSVRFNDEHGRPPTAMAKAHNLRSIVQSLVIDSERFHLAEPYTEFGRVEITDTLAERRFLLRSEGAITAEGARRVATLFDPTEYLRSDVMMLVYAFGEDALDLAVVGTRRVAMSKHRLQATGTPRHVGTWPYDAATPPPTFDQADVDPFKELGDLDIDEAGEQ